MGLAHIQYKSIQNNTEKNMEDEVMTNRKNTLNAWDRMMAAISFAEAGEQDTAVEIMNQETTQRTQRRSDTRVERRGEGTRPKLRM
jgi:hypothetical protein